MTERQFHASAVELGGRAVLIFGKSGSGKSALARALMARGAGLVGDDQVYLSIEGDSIRVSPHPNADGRIEIRGIGIFRAQYAQAARAVLAIDLDHEPSGRLPDAQCFEFEGKEIPIFNGKGVQGLADFVYLFLNGNLEHMSEQHD